MVKDKSQTITSSSLTKRPNKGAFNKHQSTLPTAQWQIKPNKHVRTQPSSITKNKKYKKPQTKQKSPQQKATNGNEEQIILSSRSEDSTANKDSELVNQASRQVNKLTQFSDKEEDENYHSANKMSDQNSSDDEDITTKTESNNNEYNNSI